MSSQNEVVKAVIAHTGTIYTLQVKARGGKAWHEKEELDIVLN